MKRENLLDQLKRYQGYDLTEQKMVAAAIHFVENNENCFDRELLTGHVTGSAWVVTSDRSHALLIHHVKLDKWLQPGGHCDGDPDVLGVAIKETFEETGILAKPACLDIFDLDIHTIPSKGDTPEHLHYDIRFLLEVASRENVILNEREVRRIEWVKMADIHHYNNTDSIERMASKSIVKPG